MEKGAKMMNDEESSADEKKLARKIMRKLLIHRSQIYSSSS